MLAHTYLTRIRPVDRPHGQHRLLAGRVGLLDVGFEIGAEELEHAAHAPNRRCAEGTEALPLDRPGQPLDQVQVRDLALAALDALQDLLDPAAALAAGRALAAAFLAVEAHGAAGNLDDVFALTDDDDAARAQRRAGRRDALEVHRRVQLVHPEMRHGQAAGDDRLDRPVVERAAGVVVDKLAQGRVVRQLVDAGLLRPGR